MENADTYGTSTQAFKKHDHNSHGFQAKTQICEAITHNLHPNLKSFCQFFIIRTNLFINSIPSQQDFKLCNDSYHIDLFKISICEPQIVMLDVKN
jgi:hypothetical protein